MRTLIYLAYFLLASIAGYAQEQQAANTTLEKKRPFSGWYYAAGVIVNPDYNINDKMLAAGNHRIADVIPSAVLGWNVILGRYIIEAEGGVAGFWKKDDGYRFTQVPITLRGNYIVREGNKFAFSVGAGFSYVASDLSIYSKESVIDIDNLDPAATSGYIRLVNTSLYVSPSVTLAFGKFTDDRMRLSFGYDFAVSNSEWKADYGHVVNPVKENGNRMYVRLHIPF